MLIPVFTPSFRLLGSLVVLVLTTSLQAKTIGPSTTLVVHNAVVKPDGFSRSATVVNGRVDRTIITGKKGDTFKINVVNRLRDPTMLKSTTIHWHGMIQRGTNWADGAAFVSQCPIATGDSFRYEFKAEFPGTYWFHSHLSTQRCDGLRGAMIVYDPADPYKQLYDVDDEDTVISLSDWFHTVSSQIPNPPISETTLVNGLGRSVGFEKNQLAVITVRRGKRYRFRVINMGCEPSYKLHIDNHPFTVIEADGVLHHPVEADQVELESGQRYSIIVNANQPVDNYWIRAAPLFSREMTFSNGFHSAILRYAGAPRAEPVVREYTPKSPLQETALRPRVTTVVPRPGQLPVKAVGRPVQGGADIVYNLQTLFNGQGFTINNATYKAPTVPVLLQILSGASSPADLLPAGSVYPIRRGATVELTLPVAAGGPPFPHPFHLHGHTFQVIRSAGSSVYNYDNPPQRDVVSSGLAGDNVTIRFVADNSGVWFLHCHVDLHLEAGMAVVFAENTPGIRNEVKPPKDWNRLCPTYNALPKSSL